MGFVKPVSIIALVALWGCGPNAGADVSAELGWQFNYRDWTKPLCPCPDLSEADCGSTAGCTWNAASSVCEDDVPAACTTDDIRACDNQPVELGAAAPFPAVPTVHVLIRDPERNQTTLDTDFDCDLGGGSEFLALQGQPRRTLELRLTAVDADGNDMYVSETPWDIDLSGETFQQRFELRTPNGDLAFDVEYPGVSVGLCPTSDVKSLRYTLTREGETDPTLVGTQSPACDDPDLFGNINANKLYIRNIPSKPVEGSTGGFQPDKYDVVVEALDSSNNVLYCGTSQRNVSPGSNSDNSSQPVTAGACP